MAVVAATIDAAFHYEIAIGKGDQSIVDIGEILISEFCRTTAGAEYVAMIVVQVFCGANGAARNLHSCPACVGVRGITISQTYRSQLATAIDIALDGATRDGNQRVAIHRACSLDKQASRIFAEAATAAVHITVLLIGTDALVVSDLSTGNGDVGVAQHMAVLSTTIDRALDGGSCLDHHISRGHIGEACRVDRS